MTTAPAYPFYTRQSNDFSSTSRHYKGWFSPAETMHVATPSQNTGCGGEISVNDLTGRPTFTADSANYGYCDVLVSEAEFRAALIAAQADISARVARLLAPVPAAPDRAAFQTAQNLLLNQMRLTQPYSQYVALQRELRTLEDTYTAAVEAHDPEGFSAAAAEDDIQAVYHANA